MIDLKLAKESPFGMAYLFGHMTRDEAIAAEATLLNTTVAKIAAKYSPNP